MKKFIIVFALAVFVTTSCKKTELQLLNPTAPTPGSALVTQGGLEAFALGIWGKTLGGGQSLITHTLECHSLMGDEQICPYGNYGWRYVDQVYAITPPAPYNTKIINPLGTTQQVQMQSLNNLIASVLSSANSNAFLWEWDLAYFLNGEANILLQTLPTNTVVSAQEKNVMQAFAYFWKGFAYSRLGSMYLGGVINNNTDGTTNGTFISHDALIAEANANLDKAIALLVPIANGDAVYTATMKVINPTFCPYPTNAAMWVREMYTMEARNYMVNKKVAVMTAADWATVKTLATKGSIAGDVVFAFGMDGTGADFSGSQQHMFEWNNTGSLFTFMSERFVQDFKAGDARYTKGVIPNPSVTANILSRGIQFGTRYYPQLIEKGGYWCTLTHQGAVHFACDYEENALMLAEANIRTGSIDAGLAFVDQVRTFQGAGLAAVANTGLSLAAATEELRSERRIALFLRGLAFYDARRWGVTAPASAGGGRANANVLVPNNYLGGSTGFTVVPCFMEYNYMDYWDVPVNEVTYNGPGVGSVAVAN